MKIELVNDWDDYLCYFPDDKKDIYFLKKYVGLYEDETHKAICAVYNDSPKIMLVPFLIGVIDNQFYDFETAYGYGGPISNTDDEEWNYKAFDNIFDYLRNNNFICGFVRFHPLLANEKLVPKEFGERNIVILPNRNTICIDTSQCSEDIWNNQISSKNRNMIRKAEKNDLVYSAEYDFASYDEFIVLYNATMQRLLADDFYFFDRSYFYKLKDSLLGNSFLGTVRKEEKLISAAIFFYSSYYGHYHLAGSDRNYSSLGANNLLLWKTACEMHRLGVKEFHLGGGTSSSPDDSLYKFKRSFSCNEKKFFIGKEVFMPEKYVSLCKEWENKNPEKEKIYGSILLKYRY